MAFSQVILSTILKKLVLEAPSLAAVGRGSSVQFLPEDHRPRSPRPDEQENRLAYPWSRDELPSLRGEGNSRGGDKVVVTAGPRPFQL